jgi:hypothetical protein
MPYPSDSAPALPPSSYAPVPCRTADTTLGYVQPFGFAVINQRFGVEGIDRWTFRSELIYLGASCWNGN